VGLPTLPPQTLHRSQTGGVNNPAHDYFPTRLFSLQALIYL